jgi:hypothetical protein
MSRAAVFKMRARLAQAQPAVDRQPNISRVVVFLPVILPPANRAQLQRFRRFQRSIPAARTTKSRLHAEMDVFPKAKITQRQIEHNALIVKTLIGMTGRQIQH